MRRLLVPLCALMVLFPSAAQSGRVADGTLSVRDARGKVTIVVKGSVIGRFGNGTMTLQELSDDEASDPVVRGYDRFRWGRNGNVRTYSGRNVRFRLIGGRYRVQLTGKGLFLSLVGKGRVMLDGQGSIDRGVFYDGFYSLNGLEEESLPDEPTWLNLAPTPPPPPPPS